MFPLADVTSAEIPSFYNSALGRLEVRNFGTNDVRVFEDSGVTSGVCIYRSVEYTREW